MSKPENARRVNAERECVNLGECRPRHASHKQTGRWCKGRVGILHAWEATKTPTHPRNLQPNELGFFSLSYACSTCGRKKWVWGERECHCGAKMVAYGPGKWSRAQRCDACGYEPSHDIPIHKVRFPDGTLGWEKTHARVECRCEKELRREQFTAKYVAQRGSR